MGNSPTPDTILHSRLTRLEVQVESAMCTALPVHRYKTLALALTSRRCAVLWIMCVQWVKGIGFRGYRVSGVSGIEQWTLDIGHWTDRYWVLGSDYRELRVLS